RPAPQFQHRRGVTQLALRAGAVSGLGDARENQREPAVDLTSKVEPRPRLPAASALASRNATALSCGLGGPGSNRTSAIFLVPPDVQPARRLGNNGDRECARGAAATIIYPTGAETPLN